MSSHGYKKYMKREVQETNPLFKIFFITFFGMLLIFTFLIKSFCPSVDTSVGDYKEMSPTEEEEISKKVVDTSLERIQQEDRGNEFSDIIARADDIQRDTERTAVVEDVTQNVKEPEKELQPTQPVDIIYKVFIGTYTSVEQAKVAKEIIQESGSGLSPIVKCIGSNNYTLQVGIFKNKQSAETLLKTIQQNNLPGRIVQE